MATEELQGFDASTTRILEVIKVTVDTDEQQHDNKVDVTEDSFSIYISGIDV